MYEICVRDDATGAVRGGGGGAAGGRGETFASGIYPPAGEHPQGLLELAAMLSWHGVIPADKFEQIELLRKTQNTDLLTEALEIAGQTTDGSDELVIQMIRRGRADEMLDKQSGVVNQTQVQLAAAEKKLAKCRCRQDTTYHYLFCMTIVISA